MKTSLLFLLLAAVTWNALGQGLVDFRNGGITFPTDADRRVYSFAVGSFGVPLTGVNYVAGLYYLPGADRGGQIGLASQAGRTFTFRPPGTLLPGTWFVPIGVSPMFALDGVAVRGSATLQVRVWDGVKYGSFEQAVASGGEFSMSAPFNYTVPAAGSAPDKYYMDNLRAWAVIPEPSTWTMAALVGATLVVVARRNGRKQRSA
ncbi:MAG TPA: hypothetical protein VNU68_04490 [Verrucomicrobiae bacterium]|nr:hypothetical protein [Verrucomicrobiae bacterium]